MRKQGSRYLFLAVLILVLWGLSLPLSLADHKTLDVPDVTVMTVQDSVGSFLQNFSSPDLPSLKPLGGPGGPPVNPNGPRDKEGE